MGRPRPIPDVCDCCGPGCACQDCMACQWDTKRGPARQRCDCCPEGCDCADCADCVAGRPTPRPEEARARRRPPA